MMHGKLFSRLTVLHHVNWASWIPQGHGKLCPLVDKVLIGKVLAASGPQFARISANGGQSSVPWNRRSGCCYRHPGSPWAQDLGWRSGSTRICRSADAQASAQRIGAGRQLRSPRTLTTVMAQRPCARV